MISLIEQGTFSSYSLRNINESWGPIGYDFGKTTVFISRKHSDLKDLTETLNFLESNYDVKVYIDSQDPSMPPVTSAETATNIKVRIIECDKFILLATNGAIESKWCNWELGFGDANKYIKNIAIFPMKPKGTSDSAYKGNEYLSIYPYIAYISGDERCTDGRRIPEGYYVVTKSDTGSSIISLTDWLRK